MPTATIRIHYAPPVGFGGTISLWAANPLVVDLIKPGQVNVYRLYADPSSGDIAMSKNGSLTFSVQLSSTPATCR